MAVILTAIVPAFGEKEVPDSVTAGDVFVNLPLKTLDILKKSTRLDMLDYYAADSIYKAVNGMEGISELVKVTPKFLDVRITPVTTMQIGVFEKSGKKSPVAIVAYTIESERQAADTDITFLDRDMNELPREKYLEYPDIIDFFNVHEKSDKEMIEDLVPFPTIKFTMNPVNKDLTAVLTVGEFMGRENYDKIKPLMKPSLLFRWNGKKYEPVK